MRRGFYSQEKLIVLETHTTLFLSENVLFFSFLFLTSRGASQCVQRFGDRSASDDLCADRTEEQLIELKSSSSIIVVLL
jgi:hypothetical protein